MQVWAGCHDYCLTPAARFAGVLFCLAAVGEHDGTYQEKRFFSCPSKHGIIVPIEDIAVAETNVSSHESAAYVAYMQ